MIKPPPGGFIFYTIYYLEVLFFLMKTKKYIILINEADSFIDSAENYSKNLDKNISYNQERIKKIQDQIKQKQESDKELEKQTKESQKYNSEQIKQNKASSTVSKDPEEQKRLKLALDRLETEKKRIEDVLKNMNDERQEFLRSKQEELKNTEESIKNDQKLKLDLQNTLKSSEQSSTTGKAPAPMAKITAEGDNFESDQDYLDKYGFMIKRKFARMEEQENSQPKKKTLIVNFDKSTKTPFQVKFTERGFLIGETRLSFEFLEAALSKDVNIVLENGSGLVLDAIRMQKILKYKDRI